MEKEDYKRLHEAQKEQRFLQETRKEVWNELNSFKNDPIKKKIWRKGYKEIYNG